MEGEGLGNYFGSLLKQAIPLLKSATIKGMNEVVKPIAVAAGKELAVTGVKRGAEAITKRIVHKKHKKRRRSRKWQSL